MGGHVIVMSPYQRTTAYEDEETALSRFVCQRIVEVLPREANDELLRTLADMLMYYLRPTQPVPTVPAIQARRIGRVTRSVRPELSLEDEG